MAAGAFLAFVVQQGLATVEAEVHQHNTSLCNMDNAAYFQAFKAKFPVPSKALQYKGASLPERCYDGAAEEHVFVIGDYGGITKTSGGSVYVERADNTVGRTDGRRLRSGDAHPQQDVAAAMANFAATLKPRFVLNGGDNFYFGGIDTGCGKPMNTIAPRTQVQFDAVFEKMYAGTGMDIPWFSVLGNHDWGGRKFTAAWDQQVAYTWADTSTKRWFLPSLYWHQHVNYPSKGFTVDFFMLDTNKADAKPWEMDEGHNICGKFNGGSDSCAQNDGPKDRYSCADWFANLWNEQDAWLKDHLKKSKADWKIIVSHFQPEGIFISTVKDLMNNYGVDLYIGSHRHGQEMHVSKNNRILGYKPYLICGGGGGITSEADPYTVPFYGDRAYGFMDLTMTKAKITIQSINSHGAVVETDTINKASSSLLQDEEEKTTAEEAEEIDNTQKIDESIYDQDESQGPGFSTRQNRLAKKIVLEDELRAIDERLSAGPRRRR
jgi:hypothetical protein